MEIRTANNIDPDLDATLCTAERPMYLTSILVDRIIILIYPTHIFNTIIPKAVRMERTVKILCIGTDRSQQTVQTKIRLLLKKQSDQGLRCLPLHQILLDALMQCYIKLYQF